MCVLSEVQIFYYLKKTKQNNPVDKRPSSDYLYLTLDTLHLEPDTWKVPHDTQGMVNIVSECQVPSY